jgi:hypothetical protein
MLLLLLSTVSASSADVNFNSTAKKNGTDSFVFVEKKQLFSHVLLLEVYKVARPRLVDYNVTGCTSNDVLTCP